MGDGSSLLSKRFDSSLHAKRLGEINQQLAMVVAERKKLSPIKIRVPKAKSKESRKKSPISKLHHPHLEAVFTEVSLSPYLTRPDKNYSKKTIQLPSLIRDIRERENASAPSIDEKDLDQFKKTFHEVLRYKQQYHPAKKKLPSITDNSTTFPQQSTDAASS
jgi:hypothetical protein